mgnify:CR=1 FL=1
MSWTLDRTIPTLDAGSTVATLDGGEKPVFTWVPSVNSQMDEEPRVLSSAFGDGYEQRTGDGINKILPKWSLRFDVRSVSEATAIRDFFRARGGVYSFEWTPPMGTIGVFICRKWSVVAAGPVSYNISAVFEEVPE